MGSNFDLVIVDYNRGFQLISIFISVHDNSNYVGRIFYWEAAINNPFVYIHIMMIFKEVKKHLFNTSEN